MIIVIDGPAGSGKSSTAKALAKKHHLLFLDSGAFYRACTWVDLNVRDDQNNLIDVLNERGLSFDLVDNAIRISWKGMELGDQIRSQEVNDNVSRVAVDGDVRKWVNIQMRSVVEKGAFIADGRDLGTVVFPNAALKFWLEAKAKVRAQRRFEEMQKKGLETTFAEVLSNIEQRDQIDSTRDIAPLQKAEDAIPIDTSELNFSSQVEIISSYISKLLAT